MRNSRPRYGVDGGNVGAPVFAAALTGLAGAVLMLAARRLPDGRAVGADI
jgi:hypothetical protein